MGLSAQHWNGHMLCAIDVETTGFEPWFHELLQICILPLDARIKPRKDLLPFNIYLRPEHPERMDDDVLKMHKKLLDDVERFGIDQEKAKDLLQEWIDKLGLPCTKYGTPKRIMPLGQNYAFDRSFLERWLGNRTYNYYFQAEQRDPLTISAYLNDVADVYAEKIPFPKRNLMYLCNLLNVDLKNQHDALADCLATAECYRRLLRQIQI